MGESQEKLSTRSSPEDATESVAPERTSDSAKAAPPNGGLEAWLTVLAGFCLYSNAWGLLSTFGAFQEYYQTVLLANESPSAISWIGSCQSTLIVLMGVVSGPMVDAGWLRSLVFTSSFMVVFGMMMTSLVTEYYQALLAQGFCVGIGGGLGYTPALVVISSKFTTKRPIAIGLASLGSSIGSVIFPIVFRRLQPNIGFGWAVRVIAFLNLALALIACGILLRRPGNKTRARSLIEPKALTEPNFMLLAISLICVFLAFYIPLFYIPSYARTKLGTSRDLSFYMLAIINGASAFGRTTPFLLGSRVKPMYVLLFATTASVIALFSWIAATSEAGLIVWLCYWGYLMGTLVTAPAAIVGHPVFCPDFNFIGTRMGMMWGICSVGGLVGTPIAGALVDLDTGHFLHAQIFAGCLMLGAMLLQLWPTFSVFRHDRAKAKSQADQNSH
ncbi:hypothetical protein VTN31DRAFT_694 [Thermomyces dupontii]|uniref:uncharacterized protein n=1 Tax=Talaromyces thermophilus TaxID=28565 RepID=UPI003741FA19